MADLLKDMWDEMTAPLVTTEYGRRAGLFAVIFFSCLLVYSSVSMISSGWQDYRLSHSTATLPKQITDNTAALIAQIPNEHLFGKAGVAQEGLPVTSLQLRLVGVIKATPETYSRVIISEGDQPGKVYRVGDTLSSGVRVHAITKDGVVLDNGGSYENLPLQRSELEFQGAPKPLKLPEEAQ